MDSLIRKMRLKKPIYALNNKRNSYVKIAMYKIVPLHFSKVTSPFFKFSCGNFGVDLPGK